MRHSLAWLETLGQDLRMATRSLKKSPGFLAVVVLSLTLGIGANTTIFSVIDTLLCRPLPYDHPQGNPHQSPKQSTGKNRLMSLRI